MSYLNSLKIPIVFTNYQGKAPQLGENCGIVQLDDVSIGTEAVRFLRSLGKFRFWAFATTAPDERFSTLRERVSVKPLQIWRYLHKITPLPHFCDIADADLI